MTTEDGVDLTLPEAAGPRPVPAGRLEDDEGSADKIEDTLIEGADATLLECPEATLIEKEATPAPRSSLETTPSQNKVFAERFEVEKVLGEGGMGRVYRVRDRQIEGRRIALKVLKPRYSRNERFRELFFKEIQAAQGFVSEHVTQVRDTGQMKDGTLFLTMDLVDGESLDQVLERETSLTPRHALEITRQVLLGLASGHDKGFVHCDVKPPNVMLTARVPKTEDNPFGVGVRVLDFGIANLATEMEAGEVIGTPRYMSPEQVQGQRLDARSDLFATGVLLYEMLSGTRPFDGTTALEVQTAVLETDVAPLIHDLEHLPDPIRRILSKALQKDREKRYQSAAEFVQAIEASKSYKDTGGLPKWVAALVVLFLIASVGEAGLLWNQRQRIDGLLSEKSEWIAESGAKMTLAVDAARQAKDDLYVPQLTSRDNQIAGLVEERNAFKDQLESISTTEEIGSGDLETAQASFEATLNQYKDDYEKEKSAREDLEQTVAELQKRQARTELKLTAQYQSANFFDDLFRRIDGGVPASALTFFRNRENDHSLPISSDQGLGLVRELVAASADLADAIPLRELVLPNSDPKQRKQALDALKLGKQHLQAAQQQAESFPFEVGSWIDEELEAGAKPDRLAKVTAHLAALEALLPELDGYAAAIAQQSEGARAAELKELLAEAQGTHPEHLLNYLEIHGFAGLEGKLDELGQWAEHRLAPGDVLDLQALGKSEVLTTFEPWLLDRDSATFTSGGVATLRWLLAARAWHAGQELPPELASLVAELPPLTSSTPTRNWRAELALQVALARPTRYPEVAGDAVLKTVWNGAPEWVRETIFAADSGDGWVIARKRVDKDGRLNPRVKEITVKRVKTMLRLDNEVVLDLRSNSCAVALWQHSLVESLPTASWAKGLDNGVFLETLEAPVPCLVFQKADNEYWYSPTHGLVRHTRGADFERELVYSSAVR